MPTYNPSEELWLSLPYLAQRGATWPKLDDLKKLNYDELKNYKLTKFEFYDYSKHTGDSLYNIAFRLYSSDGKKSNVTCSRYWAINGPESYN